MFWKRILPWGIIGGLFLSGMGFVYYNDSQIDARLQTPMAVIQKAQADTGLEIAAREIKDNKDNCFVEVRIPTIRGLESKVYQEKVNKIIADRIDKLIKEVEAEAKKNEIYNYKLDVDYSLKAKKDIFSFSLNNKIYQNEEVVADWIDFYNFNLKTQKEIALADLFDQSTDYLDFLTAEVKEQNNLRKKMGQECLETIKKVDDGQSFYISAGNLVICYPLEKDESNHFGRLEFPIPFKDVKDYLREKLDDDSIHLSSKKIKLENKDLDIDMRIPIVQGLKDEKYQEQINFILTSHAMKDKENMERESCQCSLKRQIVNNYEHCYLYSDFDLKENSKIFSFILKNKKPANNIRTDCYNIDVASGSALTVKDLFKKNVNYREIINREIEKKIIERIENGEIFFEEEESFQGISENQAFYIQEGKLIIHFAPSSIAPCKEGEKEFVIPLEIYKDSLNPNLF